MKNGLYISPAGTRIFEVEEGFFEYQWCVYDGPSEWDCIKIFNCIEDAKKYLAGWEYLGEVE